jgi:hypothetical protein
MKTLSVESERLQHLTLQQGGGPFVEPADRHRFQELLMPVGSYARLVVAIIWFFVLSPASPLPGQSCEHFRSCLASIREAVREGNKALAIELLNEAELLLNMLEERSPLDEEALRWDLAQLNLERADELTDDQAIALFADKSVRRWEQYIEWYKNLSDQQRGLLNQHPASRRIKRAVRQLGLTVVRRGNRGTHKIESLFEIYLDIPLDYFNALSVNLWKHWLFRCPSWEENANPSLQDLEARLNAGEPICREHWENYAEFLQLWIDTTDVSKQRRRATARFIERLNDVLAL